MNLEPRQDRVTAIVALSESDIRKKILSRSGRLGRLIFLQAPDLVVEIEMRMLSEAMEALRIKLGYDPVKIIADYDAALAKLVENEHGTVE